MLVELHDQSGPVGEVHLVAGLAVPTNDLARRTIEETTVVLPTESGPRGVRPEDGADYLRGLARSLTGSYFWAVLREP